MATRPKEKSNVRSVEDKELCCAQDTESRSRWHPESRSGSSASLHSRTMQAAATMACMTSMGSGVARWTSRVCCQLRRYNFAVVLHVVQRCLIRDTMSPTVIDVPQVRCCAPVHCQTPPPGWQRRRNSRGNEHKELAFVNTLKIK